MKLIKKPYKQGYFDTGDGHKLYYEFCGNKKGIPVIFLHGGPGSGFNDHHKELFDFKKFNVLFFDQRGAGRSKPFASIEANTTDLLVEDINKLLDFAGFKKVLVFGGSWGATLALIYAIRNPKRVSAIFLRSPYLATKFENDFYENESRNFFPKEHARMVSLVPESERKDVVGYYHRQMSKGGSQRRKYAFEWSLYEHSILKLVPDNNAEKSVKEYPFESLGVLETYYIAKKCFIPEGYILNNADKLKIPVSIIQGRYDLICPPIGAWELHKKIKNSVLHFVTAGHSASDPETKILTKQEMSRLARILKK